MLALREDVDPPKVIRQRLRNPTNAKPDHGINLINGRSVRPIVIHDSGTAQVVPIKREPEWLADLIEHNETLCKISGQPQETTVPPPVPVSRLAIKNIVREVARHYGVTVADMYAERRTATIVRPRHVAMYLAKMLTPNSLPEIGRRIGGRDHTTVLNAVRKITAARERDSVLNRDLEALTAILQPA